MRVDKEKAIILRQQGMIYEDIAEELNCSVDWCRKYLRGVTKGVRQKKVLYEVYIAYSTDGLLYVGSGKHGRHRHCLSGNSSSKMLNKMVFNEEGNIYVEVVASELDKESSLYLENYLIQDLNPKFNIRKVALDNSKKNK